MKPQPGKIVAEHSKSFIDFVNNLDKCQKILNFLEVVKVIDHEETYIPLHIFTKGWADYQP